MHQITQSFTLRISLSFTLCASLLLLPNASFLVSEASQGQSANRAARPRAGKPEGLWPDLEEVKHESNLTREPVAPIPSTMRAKKNEGKPWDGRRVGDPETQQRPAGGPDVVAKQTRRAHARRRLHPLPPPLYEDQFIQNFFSLALLRSATSEESTYWNNLLRAGYTQNQTSLRFAAVELGKTLFESASMISKILIAFLALNAFSIRLDAVGSQDSGRYSRFDVYDSTRDATEIRIILDNLAKQLNTQPALKAYLIAYAGKEACRHEAKSRLHEAERYLKEKHNVGPSQITFLDGGYQTNWTVQIWIGFRQNKHPEKEPTLNKNQVKFIKNCTFSSTKN